MNNAATCLYDTHDVAASQPIAGSMLTNCLRRWPNTTPTLVLLHRAYLGAAPQQTRATSVILNSVSLLAQDLRRRPDIETALGDCPALRPFPLPVARKATTQIPR